MLKTCDTFKELNASLGLSFCSGVKYLITQFMTRSEIRSAMRSITAATKAGRRIYFENHRQI